MKKKELHRLIENSLNSDEFQNQVMKEMEPDLEKVRKAIKKGGTTKCDPSKQGKRNY